MIHALISGVSLDDAVCIDAGCGEGTFAEYLLKGGARRVYGFDTDPVMIGTALETLGDYNERVSFFVDGVTHMEKYEDASIDHLFALNLAAYLSDKEEEEFYQQSARIICPGGTFTVTHSNELFDLFTLNRYTVDFFAKYFSVDELHVDVRSLLRSPDLPDRRTFNVRENPLAYKYKLVRYGFRELRQEFAHFHHTPPLLSPDRDPDEINAHEYRDTLGWMDSEKWKLMFMCSMFGSHSIRDSRI